VSDLYKHIIFYVCINFYWCCLWHESCADHTDIVSEKWTEREKIGKYPCAKLKYSFILKEALPNQNRCRVREENKVNFKWNE
jgi:hypothetical protein